MLYAILDQVVDEYEPVVAGLENDIDEIEDQLFKGGTRRCRGGSTNFSRGHRVPARDTTARRHAGPLEGGFDKYAWNELRRACATSGTTRCGWWSAPTPSARCSRVR